MKAVAQRVVSASVAVDGEVVGAIERGLLVYVGLGKGDGPKEIAWLLEKIFHLRVFPEPRAPGDGKVTERSILDAGGGLLFVSQFTLYGSLARGRRPSFDEAMPIEEARATFERFIKSARAFPAGEAAIHIATGRFQADMAVTSVNDGPYTILLESPKLS